MGILLLIRTQVSAFLIAFALLAVVSSPSDSHAQGTRTVLIVQGTYSGIYDEDMADIHEETAYIAEDLGGYVVTRDYQITTIYGEQYYAELLACGGSAPCLAQTWASQHFDDLLVVNVFPSEDELHIYYDRIHSADGTSIARTIAYLPDTVSFSHLLAAVHDALNAPAPAPQLPVVEQPASPPVVVATPQIQQPATSEPEAEPVYTEPEPAVALNRQQRAGLGLSLTGAAALTGGVLVGFMADQTQEEIQSRPHPANEVEDLQRQGKAQAAIATTAIISGSALIIGGGILYLLGHRQSERDSARHVRLDLDAGPRHTSVGLSGRF